MIAMRVRAKIEMPAGRSERRHVFNDRATADRMHMEAVETGVEVMDGDMHGHIAIAFLCQPDLAHLVVNHVIKLGFGADIVSAGRCSQQRQGCKRKRRCSGAHFRTRSESGCGGMAFHGCFPLPRSPINHRARWVD